MGEKSAIDLWANFLSWEKLDPKSFVEAKHVEQLLTLCEKLAEIRKPCIKAYKDKIESRRLVVNTAMDMGFDLLAIKRRKPTSKGTKPAIGRGLLDVWNEEYKKRFGSTVGTPGAFEIIRRKISGNMAKDRRKEEMAKRNNSENV